MFGPPDPLSLAADEPDPLLADYLDHLCAPLVGVLPFARRRQLRWEIRLHLEALAEELMADGAASQDEALSAALREFGEPWAVGERLLREVSVHAPMGRKASRAVAATEYGLAWLGSPAAACLALLTWQTLGDSGGIPPLLAALAVLTPILGGALTGFTAPAGAEAGVCRALGVVGVFSLGVGLLLLPSPAGFVFLAVLAGFWLPVGWLSASLAMSARRQLRRNRFLRLSAARHNVPLTPCEGE